MKPLNFINYLVLVTATFFSIGAMAYAQSRSDAETHDGFYLRLSLGLQMAGLDRNVEGEGAVAGFETDSKVKGGGGTSELSLGGTPATGLVLGGSILLGNVVKPVIEREDLEDLELDGPLQFAMWGFLIDYYIDKNSGFHFSGTVGGAVIGAPLPKENPFEYIGGWGWAIALATGYDWWIANQWSLGILGRLILAGVTGEDTEEGIKAEENSGYLSFGLLFTAVYH